MLFLSPFLQILCSAMDKHHPEYRQGTAPRNKSVLQRSSQLFRQRLCFLSFLFCAMHANVRTEGVSHGVAAIPCIIRVLPMMGMFLPQAVNAFAVDPLPSIRNTKNRQRSKHRLVPQLVTASRRPIYTLPNGETDHSDGTDELPLQSSATTVVDESLFWPVSPDIRSNRVVIDGDNDADDDDDDEDVMAVFDSIIKIHASHTEPSWIMPWQKKHQSTSTSSGFCISEKRIMTNAHSVEYASLVQVQKRGQSQKYRAVVEAIANDCDLAILKVVEEKDMPSFWGDSQEEDEGEESNGNSYGKPKNNGNNDNKMRPLEFGVLPELQDEVDVLGYPTGGDAMSVTSGVVSRIEMQEYAQSGQYLLAMQIDAAINPGNSGGPVVDEAQGNKVVGVAFQTLDAAENIGYVVPVSVVQHFLEDIRRHGRYTGFCSLGMRMALLENPAQRRLLQLDQVNDSYNDDTKSIRNKYRTDVGVMVTSLNPTCYASEVLKPRDVILSIDNIPVAKDGKIPFRPGERVSLGCYLQTKFLGDAVQVEILRNGQYQTVSIPVSMTYDLVPSHFHNQPPPYLLLGGFVFTVLSVPYLHALDAFEDYVSDEISYLLTLWRQDPEPPSNVSQNNQTTSATTTKTTPSIDANNPEKQELVILTQVLIHSSNLGYEHLSDIVLEKVNGQKVRSLRHLHRIVEEACRQDNVKFLELQFAPHERLVVLETPSIAPATQEICQEHNIQKPYLFS